MPARTDAVVCLWVCVCLRVQALARLRADEEALAAKIAYETKVELEKEESQRLGKCLATA